MRTTFLGLVLAPLLLACPTPPSRAARMQEAASDLNAQARFGRLELAADHVDASMRETFLAHRRLWGGEVRVADYEMLSARSTSDDAAEVRVRVAWYRPSEGDLHTTTLRQSWRDIRGDFRLVDEAPVDGDAGLFGEVPPPAPPPHRDAHFPTVRIGAP